MSNPTHEVIEKLKKAIALNASDALDFTPADELIREALALLQPVATPAPAGEARLRELKDKVRQDFIDGMDGTEIDGNDYRFVMRCLDQALKPFDALLTAAPVPHCDCGAGCAPVQAEKERTR